MGQATSTTATPIGPSTPNTIDIIQEGHSFAKRHLYRENSNLASSANTVRHRRRASPEHLYANAEFHFGNRYTARSVGLLLRALPILAVSATVPVTGNFNGDPRSAGYIANFSYWPWQNLQLAAQYTAYTRFNGGSTNYDGAGRNASANNTVYLDAKFVF